ncbi:MAG: EAL domain-containing protein, partial [Gammaproteobacteria bacterium]
MNTTQITLKRTSRLALINLFVAGAYLLLAKSGCPLEHLEIGKLWWPASGFTLAVILDQGPICLPGIFIGALLAAAPGNTGWAPLIFALASTLESAFGWHLLKQRLKLNSELPSLRDMLLLLASAPPITLFGAFLSALIPDGLFDARGLSPSWYWMADSLGILLFTPFFLLWSCRSCHLSLPRALKILAVSTLTLMTGQIFLIDYAHPYAITVGVLICFILALSAIRLGRRAATTILVLYSAGALGGAGNFADTGAFELYLFLAALSVAGMALAAYAKHNAEIVSALQESKHQFHTLIDNTSVLIWISDVEGKCNYFNQVWLDFTGRTLAQEMGNGWAESVHPDDLAQCLATYRQAFAARLPFDMEYRLRRHDGEYRWLYDHGVPRYDERARFLGYIGSLFDIDDRKAAESAMYDSEIRFRKLLEKIPLVSVQGYARDGTTNYWNQASEHLYGYTQAEAIGRKLTDLIIPQEMRAEVEQAMSQMFESGRPIPTSELRLLKKDGSPVDVFSSHAYVHVPGREPEMFCMDIDLTERKRDEASIRNLAFYDPLTQLPNRRLLFDRLQQTLNECSRTRHHGALLFFDLDNFKSLNDTLGHDKGDRLLQLVAERLTSSTRKVDIVSRLGGDEFVVVLKDLSEDPLDAPFQAESICQKILGALNRPYPLDDNDYCSTASIGVTLFAEGHISAEELMKQADIAMYQAKQAGSNTFRFFEPQMQAAVEARSQLETDLRKAVANRQLCLYYQMQVDESGRIDGAEVLLRWPHPLRGMISPAEFIPLAEDTGLIVPLGLWVLESACRQLCHWRQQPGRQHLQLSVNVSARQFRQPDFCQQVTDVLKETGASPSRLKLELTESVVLDDIEFTVKKMKALKQLGLQISMDDFGTGYSSLSCLKKLPIDQLKIDQSFVRNIATDPDDAIIVQTIIAMAHNLGMEVIAEGVETEQQRRFLNQHNCKHFQGYLFSKPLPIDQFEEALP